MQKKAFALVFGLLAVGIAAFTIVIMNSSNSTAGGEGQVVELGKRSAKAPKSWKKEEPSNKLRKAQFRVPKVAADEKDAEVAIFHFPGGGSVKENLTRWKAKFKAPKGKNLDDLTKVEEFKVKGVDVTYLDIAGDYVFQTPTPLPNYRMLAIYFDSDDGPFFITMIGPEATVTHNKKGFDDWLKAFE